jgi:hypothetical protein
METLTCIGEMIYKYTCILLIGKDNLRGSGADGRIRTFLYRKTL